MARSPKLRFRRSAAQLHALAAVERTIRATDTTGRRKYLRDFGESFKDYRRVLLPSEVDARLPRADIILVGDYHALPACQRYTATLVEKIADSGRRVILGLEAIVARDQHILDEWQRDEIDADELRSRIRFESDWGYAWHPFRELLQRAKAAGARICGLDCTPRQDMRSIRARDRHAAVKIDELRTSDPDAVLVVLFGESHLAPTHLPLLVRSLRQQDRVLTILQNVDTLYWQSAGEPQDLVEAVEVCDDVVCVFSATPLEKYENYRLCIERWKQERAGKLDLAPSFYNLITTLWQFLGVNPYSACSGRTQSFLVDELPEVWCAAHAEQLDRLLTRRCSTRAPEVRTAMKQQGSHFLSERNVIIATEFRMPWAAEQAARFVHHACRGHEGKPLNGQDEFYLRVMEFALAFFGSKVLCPSRRLFSESEIYDRYMHSPEEVEREGWDLRGYLQMLDFIVLHKDYERNRRKYARAPELLAEGIDFDPRRKQEVIRVLGHSLGSKLYSAYLSGNVGRRWLRRLYCKEIARQGFARAMYFRTADLVHRECSDEGCEW
ncbi:MAG: ChaN family lipoprotein [Terriglobales bacterium]